MQRGELLQSRVGARSVVGHDRATVGDLYRSDLPVEEPVLLRLDSPILGPLGELVHPLPGDSILLGNVLSGVAHGDVDIVDEVVPVGLGEAGIEIIAVKGLAIGTRHRFGARSDVGVTFAQFDCVKGHANRLKRGRTEPVDGRGGNRIGHPTKESCWTGHVVARFVMGETTSDHHVVYLGPVDFRNFLHHGVDGEPGKVVGTNVYQRSLVRPTYWGAGGGDDYCFGHAVLLVTILNARSNLVTAVAKP